MIRQLCCKRCKCNYAVFQGGEHVELIPGGNEVEVNASNVADYVRKYAELRLVKIIEKPLTVCCW